MFHPCLEKSPSFDIQGKCRYKLFFWLLKKTIRITIGIVWRPAFLATVVNIDLTYHEQLKLKLSQYFQGLMLSVMKRIVISADGFDR